MALLFDKTRDSCVIVAGGTGQGKSTTLAEILSQIIFSDGGTLNIIEIREPIETDSVFLDFEWG